MLEGEKVLARNDVRENARDLLEALYLLVDVDLECGEELHERTTVRIRAVLRKHGMFTD